MIEGAVAVVSMLWLVMAGRRKPPVLPCSVCQMPPDMHHAPGCPMPCRLCTMKESWVRKRWGELRPFLPFLGILVLGIVAAMLLIYLFGSA